MKKIVIVSWTILSIFLLAACEQNKKVDEAAVKEFVQQVKSITHNVNVGELDNAYFLTATKNYFSDEWYEVVEQNRPVNGPFNFVQQAQKNVSLTDVTIHSIEETDDGYNVAYTLYLAIGDDTEVIEKTGSMSIVQHDSDFLITYDKENMIIVDGIKFF